MVPALAAALGPMLVTPGGDTFALQHLSWEAAAEEGWVFVESEQRFANPFSEPVDASYVLKLPAGTVVRGMGIDCGGRSLVVAPAAWNERPSYHRDTETIRGIPPVGIDDARVVEIPIASICAGADVGITMEYVTPLKTAAGTRTVRFPTAGVATRARLAVDEGFGAQIFEEVRDPDPQRSPITFSWVTEAPLSDAGLWAAARVLPPDGDEAGRLSVILEAPWDSGLPVHPRDVSIAIDTAQDERELGIALAAARGIIARLRPEDRFDLVETGREKGHLWGRSRPIAGNVDEAEAWLQGRRPNRHRQVWGWPAPRRRGSDGRLPLDVLLTDGELTSPEVVVERLGEARLFALATDPTIDHSALRHVAAASGGDVVVHDGADPANAVRAIADRIDRPLVVDWARGESNATVWSFRSRIPDLFAGYPVRAWTIYRAPSPEPRLRLIGRGRGSKVDVRLPLSTEGSPAVQTARELHQNTAMWDDNRYGHHVRWAIEHRFSGTLTPLLATSEGPSPCGPPLATILQREFPSSAFVDPVALSSRTGVDVLVSPPWVRGSAPQEAVRRALASAPRECMRAAPIPRTYQGYADLYVKIGADGATERLVVRWISPPLSRRRWPEESEAASSALEACLASTVPPRVAALAPGEPQELRALMTLIDWGQPHPMFGSAPE